MRIFISVGEPSGDLHGANLIRRLRQLRPDIECVGFGGERMQAAGCRLLYPLAHLAVMGFVRIFASMHVFLRLVSRADRYFAQHRPDAVVLIDYPGFNWWMARRAHFHGIPVYYFVPPQLWGWGGWRIRKMQRWVDHVLCTLPFEEDWYRQRSVSTQYVGHPYFDEMREQYLDGPFVAHQEAEPGRIIGLLPGSRTQEVASHIGTLVRAAQRIHAARPETRFLVACFKPAHARQVEAYLRGRNLPYLEVCARRTPEVIYLAHACIAVSGSVGLELLYRGKPSVVVYRTTPFYLRLVNHLKTARFISLVNLLANAEVFPEFLTDRCEAEAISGHILRWLEDPAAHAEVCRQLAVLRERVSHPGACDRAAERILDLIEHRPDHPTQQAA